MTKNTKYYMAGTDEEVLLGDVIEIDLTRDLKDGSKQESNVEIKITEETLPHILDLGIIDKREVEEPEDLLDFGENNDIDCPYVDTIETIIKNQKILSKNQEILEKRINWVKQEVGKFISTTTELLDELEKELEKAKKEEKPISKTTSAKKK